MGQCFSSTGGEPVERAGPAPAAGGQVQAESTDRIQKKEADAAMALLQGDVPAEAATWVRALLGAEGMGNTRPAVRTVSCSCRASYLTFY